MVQYQMMSEAVLMLKGCFNDLGFCSYWKKSEWEFMQLLWLIRIKRNPEQAKLRMAKYQKEYEAWKRITE